MDRQDRPMIFRFERTIPKGFGDVADEYVQNAVDKLSQLNLSEIPPINTLNSDLREVSAKYSENYKRVTSYYEQYLIEKTNQIAQSMESIRTVELNMLKTSEALANCMADFFHANTNEKANPKDMFNMTIGGKQLYCKREVCCTFAPQIFDGRVDRLLFPNGNFEVFLDIDNTAFILIRDALSPSKKRAIDQNDNTLSMDTDVRNSNIPIENYVLTSIQQLFGNQPCPLDFKQDAQCSKLLNNSEFRPIAQEISKMTKIKHPALCFQWSFHVDTMKTSNDHLNFRHNYNKFAQGCSRLILFRLAKKNHLVGMYIFDLTSKTKQDKDMTFKNVQHAFIFSLIQRTDKDKVIPAIFFSPLLNDDTPEKAKPIIAYGGQQNKVLFQCTGLVLFFFFIFLSISCENVLT